VGQERLGPSYFFISLVLGPQTASYGTYFLKVYGVWILFFVSARTNKDNIIKGLRSFLGARRRAPRSATPPRPFRQTAKSQNFGFIDSTNRGHPLRYLYLSRFASRTTLGAWAMRTVT
jgi:hypothetical protein